MGDKLRILLGNVNQILVDIIRDDITKIDIAIEKYDSKKGVSKLKIDKELKRRNVKLMNIIADILAELQAKKIENVVKLVKSLYVFIMTDYFKSVNSNFKNFTDFLNINNSIVKKLRHLGYNIKRFMDNKNLAKVYIPFPENFLYDFFKLEEPALTIQTNEFDDPNNKDEEYKQLYLHFKQLYRLIDAISSLLTDVKIKQLLVEFTETHPLKKKFPLLLEKIIKLLEKSRNPEIRQLISRIIDIDIIKQKDDFFIYLEKRKEAFLLTYEEDILNKFYEISLKKKVI